MTRSYAASDINLRIRKAKKIVSILKNFKDLKKCCVLDIGCGSGYISSYTQRRCRKLVGVDVVDERKVKDFEFHKIKNLKSISERKFDIIIANHVIEHVQNSRVFIKQIKMLMKKDSICYITAPNKFWPIEHHLKLPFLALMPKKLADYYVQVTGKGADYDVKPFSYSEFKKLLKDFYQKNFTLKILKDPEYYGYSRFLKPLSIILKILPSFLSESLNYFVPNWIFVIQRK